MFEKLHIPTLPPGDELDLECLLTRDDIKMHFYDFATQAVEIIPRESLGQFVPYSQCCGCWWLGAVGSRNIGSYGIDLAEITSSPSVGL